MPETTAYYHAAYVVAGLLYGGYVVSLWWRARRLRKRSERARMAIPRELK